jgi:hypothetical protein
VICFNAPPRPAPSVHPLNKFVALQFNVLWLDPDDPESFPKGLIDALEQQTPVLKIQHSGREYRKSSIETRLRMQMQEDALQPLSITLDDDTDSELRKTTGQDYTSDTIQEAAGFIRLDVCAMSPLKYACLTSWSCRHQIDWHCCLRIYATSMLTAFGAGPNTATKTRWTSNVLE